MDRWQVYELSHDLWPGKEEFQFEAETRFVEEFLPYYRGLRPPESWYVMTEIRMWSHLGTHMEAPYHYFKDGADAALIPLDRVVGECALVDFSDKQVGESVTREDLQQRGIHIRESDIVFFRFGRSSQYRTERARERPYLDYGAVQWLVEHKISCLGVDVSGIEERGIQGQPAHELLFTNGIPLIEHLANLEQLQVERFFVVAVPLRMHKVDASPVSVIGLVESPR
jgi:arylformamidase